MLSTKQINDMLVLDVDWYVSNVSLIFDAPCLFLHHFLSVSLHFVAVLCIFRNYPINEMPQCQFPVFCCFCVSEKLHRKYSQNWTKQKPDVQIFNGASRRPNRRRRKARGWPHHQGARPSPWPRRPMVRATWSTSDDVPSPIKTPRREKSKYPITFPEYIAIRRRRRPKIGRVQKLFPAPCRRGNRHRRSSSSPCLPPARWVSSLPWTMGP
jgi:hypothetical protein